MAKKRRKRKIKNTKPSSGTLQNDKRDNLGNVLTEVQKKQLDKDRIKKAIKREIQQKKMSIITFFHAQQRWNSGLTLPEFTKAVANNFKKQVDTTALARDKTAVELDVEITKLSKFGDKLPNTPNP